MTMAAHYSEHANKDQGADRLQALFVSLYRAARGDLMLWIRIFM